VWVGVSRLEAAAVLVCILEKMQSGSPYATELPQAAQPNRLTDAIGFCSAEAGSSREPSGAKTEQAPPRQPYRAHASGTSLLSAASRRLVRGRQSWGNGAGFCNGLAALAAIYLLGFLVAASWDA